MGRRIQLTGKDGFKLGAYRAEPKGAANGGVVICQEIFGVNSYIESVCDYYAEAGFHTIAPALFDRVERDVDNARTLDFRRVRVDFKRRRMNYN